MIQRLLCRLMVHSSPSLRVSWRKRLVDVHGIRFKYIRANSLEDVPRPGPVSSIPRGPPRKPKQSGHALWVGNLPPGTTVVALKDHFSRDATKDIESLFLISKSNCAFVNYRTEESCTAAMHRFHDSRFNGVRLVCRLRRSSAPASGVPTAPSAMIGQQKNTSRPATPVQDGALDDLEGGAVESPVHKSAEDDKASADVASKYFIVKSLTLQDLELSVRNGIWATQSHNEDVLNKAFRVSNTLYPIHLAGLISYSLLKTYILSFLRTNRANISVTPAWRHQFSKMDLVS